MTQPSSIRGIPQPVLITGGAGFIGAHLAERLLAEGHEVIVFDLPGARLSEIVRRRARVLYGDVASREDVRAAMQGVGTVFHAAAVVSDWAPRAAYERVTLQGSRFVFEEAVRNGAHVLLISSGSVYGDKIGRTVLREDEPLGRPLGLYSEYKQKQEMLAWEFHRTRGMVLTVVRPFKVFGPGSRPWVHEVAAALRAGRPTLIGGGNYNSGLIYIDHLVDILLLAASAPHAQGRCYNGYDGSAIPLRQYVTDLARIIGAPPPREMPLWAARTLAAVIGPTWRMLRCPSRPLLTNESLRMLSSDYQISTERVFNELGFVPRISYAEAMRRLETYWRAQSAEGESHPALS